MNSESLKSALAGPDRRQFYRRKYRGKIEIEWGSATLSGTVRDIGPRGLFVELSPPLWVGATFLAHLILTPVLDLNCTVRRVEPAGGIAISFEVVGEGGKVQLEELLAGLPKS